MLLGLVYREIIHKREEGVRIEEGERCLFLLTMRSAAPILLRNNSQKVRKGNTIKKLGTVFAVLFLWR